MRTSNRIAKIAVVIVGILSSWTLRASAQDVITTIAGGGPSGMPAVNANLNSPEYIAFDSQGNYYFTTYLQSKVFKVSTAGVITLVAGTGIAGYSGDGGLAVDAELNGPWGIAVDGANPANVYISDSNNCIVRKVTASTGVITTIAGGASGKMNGCGYSGDGGTANAAQLNVPIGLGVDKNGDLYIADSTNGRVRKVSAGSPTGTISTVAGGGGSTTAANNCRGSAPYGDAGAANKSYLCYPSGIALDTTVSPANVFVTEASTNNRCTIREVVRSTANIYRIAGEYGSCGFTDGVVATNAELYNPDQVQVSTIGGTSTVTFSDYNNARVRQFTLTYSGGVPQSGTIKTVAGSGNLGFCGDGGAALDACIYYATGVALDASGNLYVGDRLNGRIRKVTKSTGDISTVAGWGNADYASNIYYSDPAAMGTVPATGLSLYYPAAVFADRSSNDVYIGGYYSQAEYVFDSATGSTTTVAGNGFAGFAGDGAAGNATGSELNYPAGAAKDSDGNVYIADINNCAVREVIASTGDLSTIAGGSEGHLNGCAYSGDGGAATKAQLSYPHSLTIDASDNLYIADYSNCVIRKVVLSTGIITTVAGNHTCGYNGDGILATSAELYSPQDVAVDSSGNIYIADFSNQRVRMVDAVTGLISTVAGDGVAGYTGDGTATGHSLYNPVGVATDPSGNLFITDYSNNLLRWVDPGGTMVTIAGSPVGSPQGSYGFAGDGGLATSALLASPNRSTQDGAGNYYIADQYNYRIRKVTAFAGYGRSTSTLDFDEDQPIGTTSGYAPLTLSAIGPTTFYSLTVPAGFSEVDDCVGNDLVAGDTCEIDLYFTPTKGGVTTGTLKINSNAFFKTQGNTVEVSGNAVGLMASGVFAFPTQLVGASSTQTVTIKNTGALVKLDSLSVPGSTSFTVTGGTCKTGNTLATGASCTVSVTFKAASTGAKVSALSVASSDPASPLLVSVDGTATTLTFSPASLAFGTVIDKETKTLNLTVTNSTGSFTISPAITGSAFTILATGNTCATAIAAGKTCNLPVEFAPTAVESYTGTLTLVAAAGTASPTVALTGTGSTNITVTPTAIAFTTITHGSNETTNLTLKNLGAAALTLSTAFSGSGAADYTISTTGNTCGTSLAAGDSCTLPVKFAPAAAETYDATLTITTNGGTDPTITLTGTGK
jgi:sugar lactone lactonase YvrE